MKATANAKPRAKPKETLPIMFTVPPGTSGLLSKYQVAALLSIGMTMFKGMVATGEYPPADVRLGKLARWKVDTHNEWVASRGTKAKA